MWTGLHFDPTHRGTHLRAVSIVSNTALNFYAYFVCGCCIELFGDAVSEPSRSFQTSNNPEGKGLRTVLRVHCRASEIPWVQQAGLSFKSPDLSGWFSNPPGPPFSNPVSLLPEDFPCSVKTRSAGRTTTPDSCLTGDSLLLSPVNLPKGTPGH